MKRQDRFYIEHLPAGETIVFTKKSHPALVHQWSKVLRYKVGDTCIVFSDTHECSLEISSHEKDTFCCTLQSTQELPIKIPLHLWMPILHPSHIETLLTASTQIGITDFHFFTSAYTQQQRAAFVTATKIERWKKLIIEATEQSRRKHCPRIDSTISTFDELPTGNEVAVACESLSESTQRIISQPLHLIIGPEGGWSPEEVSHFSKHSMQTISLGQNILRAEIAGIVLSYLGKNFQR